MPEVVRTELRAGALRVTLDRPEVHNALDEEVIEGLRQAVERAAAERDALAVVLQGAGPSFCAGADVAWMREMGLASEEENRRSAERLARLFLSLERLEKPIVARVQGAVMGGGVGLVAAADIAVASARARFALSEVRLGVIPAVIAPCVVRKVGLARARELMLTARRFDGLEAAAMGLVSRAVDDTLLDPAVENVLEQLRAGGPQAIAATKRLLRELASALRTPEETAAFTARRTAEARAGEEARAGLQAFLDKQPPPWAQGGTARS